MILRQDRDKASRLRRKRKRRGKLSLDEHRWLLDYDRRVRVERRRRKIASLEKKARKSDRRTSALTDAKSVTLALALWTVEGEKRKPRRPKIPDSYYYLRLRAWERYQQCKRNLRGKWEVRPTRTRPGIARATTTFDAWAPPIEIDFPESFNPDHFFESGADPISLTVVYPSLPPASGRAISTTIRYDVGKGFWVNAIALTRDWESAAVEYVRAIEKYVTRYESDSINGISTFVR